MYGQRFVFVTAKQDAAGLGTSSVALQPLVPVTLRSWHSALMRVRVRCGAEHHSASVVDGNYTYSCATTYERVWGFSERIPLSAGQSVHTHILYFTEHCCHIMNFVYCTHSSFEAYFARDIIVETP